MKRFFVKLSLLLLIPLMMAMVNYTVDPAHLFSGDMYVQALASNIMVGKNISDFNPNYNERSLEKLMVSSLTSSKDIMVLGSSRCKGISAEMFPGKTFRNAGVSAGTLEDFLGIYQLYYEKGLLPGMLILELSPWLLNPNNEQIHADTKTLEIEDQRMRTRMGFDSETGMPLLHWLRVAKYIELLSPAYFQQSLGGAEMLLRNGALALRAIRGVPKEHKVKDVSKTETSDLMFRIAEGDNVAGRLVLYADGSWLSAEEYRVVTRAEALDHVANPKGLQRFTKLLPDRISLFESFVDIMRSDGIKVVFYMPPYHPVTYNGLVASPKYRIVRVEEEYFRDFAMRRGIEVYGSYDPARCGCVGDDFADCVHLRRSVLPKLFSRITE